jgi:type IV pilus assembly protein PilP
VRVLTFVLFVASAPAIAAAQTTPAPTAPAKAAAPAAEAPPRPAAPESYSYDPAGRRDPFMNLLGAGSNQTTSRKGEGPSGIAVAEISVRGVLQSRNGLIAMVQGPDNKTYIVHQGDKLLDGSIKTITTQGLIIEQDVNDPLSVVKQREVRRLLRGLEDPK